ncbi:MAG: DUF433 domain-containing protein [Candidatus Hodarchaeales archaeon]
MTSMTEVIESNPEILNGKPVFSGTRIPVELVYELIGLNYTIDQILEEYPTLSREKILLAVKLGKEAINNIGNQDLEATFLEEKIET